MELVVALDHVGDHRVTETESAHLEGHTRSGVYFRVIAIVVVGLLQVQTVFGHQFVSKYDRQELVVTEFKDFKLVFGLFSNLETKFLSRDMLDLGDHNPPRLLVDRFIVPM